MARLIEPGGFLISTFTMPSPEKAQAHGVTVSIVRMTANADQLPPDQRPCCNPNMGTAEICRGKKH